MGSPEQRSLQRTLVESAGIGLAYFVVAKLSLHLSLVGNTITPFWPPTGIALAGFVIFGRSCWPGVFAGAFLANVGGGPSALATAGIAVGNTLAPATAAWLLERTGFRPDIARLRDALALVFLGALLSMGISATGGVTVLVATGDVRASSFPSAWAVWWAGDAMGVLVVAPFLLAMRRVRSARARAVELASLLAVVGLVSYLLFTSELAIQYAVFPLLGFVAWRFGQIGAAPAALIATSIATWAAVDVRGPFAGRDLAGQMVTLQIFNAGVALTSFMLAALTTERAAARAAVDAGAALLEERVRQRTAELTELNERFAEAQALTHIGSWTWDLQARTLVWSDELYRVYGRTLDEPLDYEAYLSQIHPDDRDEAIAMTERTIATSQPFAARRRIVRPNGELRWINATGQVVRDAGGNVLRLYGTSQDITDQVRAEEAIASTEERFRSLAETANDAIVTVNDQYVLKYLNPAAVRMFGDVLGTPVSRLCADVPAAIKGGANILESEARTPDGRAFPIEVSIATTVVGDDVTHAMIIRDVTAAKAMEDELRRLNAAKTDFIATAAHELRTPLAAIDGIAEALALRAELPDERVGDLIARLQRQTDRLNRLFSNLLDLSQIDAGVLRVHPRRVSMDAVARAALDAAPPPDGVRVEVAGDDVEVDAQRERVEQVLINLLTNAYRYGGPNVTIELAAEDGTARVSVHDDGAGIDPDLAPYIFERFRRGATSRSDAAGLGLAIVRGVVEAHGGRVWYSNGAGGSTFSFTLPRATGATTAAT